MDRAMSDDGHDNNNTDTTEKPKTPISFGTFLSSRQNVGGDSSDAVGSAVISNSAGDNNVEFVRGATQQLPVHAPSPNLLSSMATIEPIAGEPNAHKTSHRFADFIWNDGGVYEQRSWLGALCKDPDSRFPAQHVSSFPAPSASTPLTSPSTKQIERRRRMTAGSTLRTIGEQSILAGSNLGGTAGQPGAMYTMDVKAWPAFSHYKATLAQLNGQRARMKIMIGANGVLGQSRSPPLVVKGRRVVSMPALQHKPGQALPPTFASIMAKPTTASVKPPSKQASKDPSCTYIVLYIQISPSASS